MSADDARRLEGAMARHRAGDLEGAAGLYREILERDPGCADAWHLVGLTEHQRGRSEQAVPLIERAIELSPQAASYHASLGNALRAGGDPARAVDCLERAVELDPRYAAGWSNLGHALRAAGRAEESVAAFRRAIDLEPALAEARFNLASTLHGLGRLDEAIEHYRQVIAEREDLAAARDGLNEALAQQAEGLWSASQPEEAVEAHRRAVEAAPGALEPRKSLGDRLQALGRLREAEEVYLRALEIDPQAWTIHNSLGSLYVRLQDKDKALRSFRQALVPEPRVEPLNNLGVLLRRLGRLEEAAKPLRLAIKLDPSHSQAANNLAITEADQGRLHDAERRLVASLKRDPTYAVGHSNLVYFLNFRDDVDPREIYRAHLEWGARHADPLLPASPPPPAAPDPERRLKVGYVSPDFRRHSVSYFFAPVLEAHDRARFEVVCYAELYHPDEVTERLRRAADGWVSITGLGTDAAARRVREDGIDILVDLAGHTADNRLLVFAHKPAPVQVSWLGYPNTTGMRAIDYRLVDDIVEPPGPEDALSVEKVVRLPEGFHCYEPPAQAPPVSELPAARAGKVTFGSFNDLKKIQPAVIRCWARILEAVPDSRLWLKCASFGDAPTRELYAQAFAEEGIDPDRLTMIPRVSSTQEHLALYGRIDIALDTFPYNGTTTTCEALWMGVPIVGLWGERHASRVGASLLTRVGLEDWLAEDPAGYVDLAVSWAGRLEDLAALRKTLRRRVAMSPLCDAAGLTRSIERAYRGMWRARCAERVSQR